MKLQPPARLMAKPIDLAAFDVRTRDRFWAKVNRNGAGECWEWTAGRKPSGYGQFGFGGLNYPSHRVAYALLVGPADPAMDLDHLCRNRACVNPAHLEPVTRRENLRRGSGHGSETHCPQGHPYTPENIYRDNGARKCRTCVLIRARKRYRGKANV